MYKPYFLAFDRIRRFATDLDLEKYFDIYEISKMDVEDAQTLAQTEAASLEVFQGLHELKVSMQKLHTIRKVFLCCLLALDADGGKVDFTVWSTAADALTGISTLTANTVSTIDAILCEEEGR